MQVDICLKNFIVANLVRDAYELKKTTEVIRDLYNK